jgi:hypothetical protein
MIIPASVFWMGKDVVYELKFMDMANEIFCREPQDCINSYKTLTFCLDRGINPGESCEAENSICRQDLLCTGVQGKKVCKSRKNLWTTKLPNITAKFDSVYPLISLDS